MRLRVEASTHAAGTTCSPCVDTGTATGAPDDDIEGDSRPQDIALEANTDEGDDMGSDELVAP